MNSDGTAAWTLEQKIARMCVAGLPSLHADSAFEGRLRDLPMGGIGLFPHNIDNEDQLRSLIRGVQDAAGRSGIQSPYYLSIDEEGGSLANLKSFFPPVPGNRAIGLTADPEGAFLQGKLIGSQLAALGIPMNWAPVLDVNTNIVNPVVGVRSFGEDPAAVAELGAAYIRGMHEAGIAVTAKHFPGHGQVDGDSHIELPFCGLTLEELKSGPLLPFTAAVAAGCDAIMMAHIVFPAIPQSAGLPASLSPYFVTELLRKELGFEGVICTDDVEMGAIRNSFEPEVISELAVIAGNDLILMCHTPGFQDRVICGIAAAVRGGRIAESRIDESLKRIARLQERMLQHSRHASPLPRSEWKDRIVELTRRTVKLERDPGQQLPLAAGVRYLLLLPRPERLTLADNTDSSDLGLGRLLTDRGLQVKVKFIPNNPDEGTIAEVMEGLENCDAVIMGTWNAHVFSGQVNLAAAIVLHKPLIAAVLRNPYDAGRLPSAASVILVCGTSSFSLAALADVLTSGSTEP
ncbi:glycoside hydrolase family 3 [Paenibacillus sp. PK3_47]|uniref:glycoside hydrolase family 3 protein n=1 Tax=Paenibacillus sp. PK3_47 TaxID=2072642 RepID=UPI00201E13E4|nr:glycoside hydrolase family 3 protein [Paenibacillus sp. PK3_47]UQZ37097.1 glycoside hydrolase family 3 [Paenibacillus sp. PK3_47]